MTEQIDIKKLEELMGQLTPEEIRAGYGDRLDEESRHVFAEFETFNVNLQGYHADLSRLIPPVPNVDHSQTGHIVSFWRRPVLPAWSLPLAAAATFFLGMVMPAQQGVTSAVETQPQDIKRNLVLPQSEQVMQAPTKYDTKIADAIFERGFYHMDQEDHALAFGDFKTVHRLNPNDDRVLDYLIVVTSQLKLFKEQKRYQDLKDKAAGE